MSAAVDYIRCRGCCFEAAMCHGSVVLQYHLPDHDVVEGYRRFAWCTSCQNITEAEEAFDPARIQADIDAVVARRPGFLVRLIDRAFGGGDADRCELEALSAKLKLARVRTSAPRCLRCAAATVETLTFDDHGVSNIVHLCGARLFAVSADPNALRFSFTPEVIALDSEGRRIRPP